MSRTREVLACKIDASFRREVADSRVEALSRPCGRDFVFDRSFWRDRSVRNPFRMESRNWPLDVRLLHRTRFAVGGAIQRETVSMDLAAIPTQLPQGPTP